MNMASALGRLGRILISTGAVVLLFVAYQLWGTGLQYSEAQADLESDFAELLSSDLAVLASDVSEAPEIDDVDAIGITPSDEPPEVLSMVGDAPASIIQLDPNDTAYSAQFLSALYPDSGESLARMVIPAIGLDQILVEGVSVEDLRKGPGHYPSTPNPGQAGNASIAGHRTTYGAPFGRIDELQPGDEISVTTLQGNFVYRVRANTAPDGTQVGHFIVSPSDTWVLDQTGENLLTLTSCHPKYSARQRIIVQAELVGEPAPTISRADDAEVAPLDLSAGAEDEAVSTISQRPEDLRAVISDEAAADDDPTFDSVMATPSQVDNPVPVQVSGAKGTSQADEVELVSDPSQARAVDSGESQTSAIATNDFGEGLNGDRTKIKPAILWGLASMAIWTSASFIGRRTDRKWTMYAIALVPYALVLWSAFVNVDQALPGY